MLVPYMSIWTSAPMGTQHAIMPEMCDKGWKNGLFAIKCPLCCFNWCCEPCSLAQIHEKLGNPNCGKPVACLVACCVPMGAEVQMLMYGTSMGDSGGIALLKCLCCGECYLHQMYKEKDCVEGLGPLIMTSYKPSQSEMN